MVFLILFSTLAHAHFDYSVGFSGRTVPVGAALNGKLGYNYLLWGPSRPQDPANGSPDEPQRPQPGEYLYGFLRPSATIASSFFINRGDLILDFYPISFFSLGIGQSISFRNTNLPAIDCGPLTCRGPLTRTYLQSKLLAGYENFFAVLKSQFMRMSSPIHDRPFVDEYTTITATAEGDFLFLNDFAVGYRASENIAAGIIISVSRMIKKGSMNNFEAIFGRYKINQWSIATGLGFYQSSLQSRSPSAFLALEWQGANSLEPK